MTLPEGVKGVIRDAMMLQADIQHFERTWTRQSMMETPTPAFSWEQLERQLMSLCNTQDKAFMVPHLISGIRKQARFKPSEMVLREILCVTNTLMDESFAPETLVDEPETI